MTIDTNTINFGVSKLKEAVSAITPTISAVSQEYVRYVVYKTLALEALYIFIFISGFISYKYGRHVLKGEDIEWESGALQEGAWPAIIGAMIMIAMAIVIFLNIYDCVLIMINPKMFVLEKFVNK